jgi:hypothetical protein
MMGRANGGRETGNEEIMEAVQEKIRKNYAKGCSLQPNLHRPNSSISNCF